MKKINLSKKDLIHMVMGSWPHGGGYHSVVYLQEKGLMVFSGNQWNEYWSWSERGLKKLSKDGLYQLYLDLKKGDKFWDNPTTIWE